MPASWANTGAATAAERIARALSAFILVIGFLRMAVGRKPPIRKDVPIFNRKCFGVPAPAKRGQQDQAVTTG
jgi:hypothetical protein